MSSQKYNCMKERERERWGQMEEEETNKWQGQGKKWKDLERVEEIDKRQRSKESRKQKKVTRETNRG
jgi:hypothetical protein